MSLQTDDVVLSPSLLCRYTCSASDLRGNFIFIVHGADLDIYSQTVIEFNDSKKLPVNLLIFLTVQDKYENVNVSVSQNSIHHKMAWFATETLYTLSTQPLIVSSYGHSQWLS